MLLCFAEYSAYLYSMFARLNRELLTVIKEAADLCAVPFYKVTGRRPWTPGYYTAKVQSISAAIDQKVLHESRDLPAKFGFGIDERIVEYPWVFSQLSSESITVLDAGSSLNHAFLLDRLPLERLKLTIMTLAPEKRCFWRRSLSYVYGDLRQPVFADASFDAVVSISTIEHIGLNNTLLYTSESSKNENDILGFVPAVKEFRRILKPGGVCLITVPFGRREVYDWYQVFDNVMVEKVVNAFEPTEMLADYFGYSSSGWHRAASHDLADAIFQDQHNRRGAPSDRAAAARGLACLRLTA